MVVAQPGPKPDLAGLHPREGLLWEQTEGQRESQAPWEGPSQGLTALPLLQLRAPFGFLIVSWPFINWNGVTTGQAVA